MRAFLRMAGRLARFQNLPVRRFRQDCRKRTAPSAGPAGPSAMDGASHPGLPATYKNAHHVRVFLHMEAGANVCVPFAPRSREKVARQRRMRGRGSRDSDRPVKAKARPPTSTPSGQPHTGTPVTREPSCVWPGDWPDSRPATVGSSRPVYRAAAPCSGSIGTGIRSTHTIRTVRGSPTPATRHRELAPGKRHARAQDLRFLLLCPRDRLRDQQGNCGGEIDFQGTLLSTPARFLVRRRIHRPGSPCGSCTPQLPP